MEAGVDGAGRRAGAAARSHSQQPEGAAAGAWPGSGCGTALIAALHNELAGIDIVSLFCHEELVGWLASPRDVLGDRCVRSTRVRDDYVMT